MQRRRGLIYPRIVEEIVNPEELQKVWNCGYLTVNRIMYGRKAPNHQQKEQLSEYLGIPVNELWVRDDSVLKDKVAVSNNTLSSDNSEII